jgi:hypothetical protein
VARSISQYLSLTVRQEGNKLACYVTGADLPDTIDQLPLQHSHVKCAFDEDALKPEEWILSDSSTALFYPGKASEFIQKMRQAKRFVIEYSPTGGAPQSTSFNVSFFPEAAFPNLNRGD